MVRPHARAAKLKAGEERKAISGNRTNEPISSAAGWQRGLRQSEVEVQTLSDRRVQEQHKMWSTPATRFQQMRVWNGMRAAQPQVKKLSMSQ
jgi:hypothetical protein